MIILTKITVTLAIIGLTSYLGYVSTADHKDLYKWTAWFGVGLLSSLLGLILCLIAYVWMR